MSDILSLFAAEPRQHGEHMTKVGHGRVTHVNAWRRDVGPLPDSRWAPLLRVGAISAGMFVVLNVAAIVLAIVTPPPPTSG